MSRQPETIAAIATPAGVGGIAVIRLSGPEAVAIAAAVIGRRPDELPDRMLVHGIARGAAGARLDEVLVVAMRGPRSYTGEDVAEVHGHGGALNSGRLLRELLRRGARAAEPGEFTRRAFENGKLDLARAEALLAVIEAGSERAWRLGQAQLAGELGARVASLRAGVTELLAEVEAGIDFPEDDVDAIAAAGDVMPGTLALADEIGRLAATFSIGRAVRDGVEVAIVGPVNAGKSSLFNALLGDDRAIVTEEPGTTRDVVEGRTVWQGIPVTLLDTAGERISPTSRAEELGMERGRTRAARADLRLVVTPAPTPERLSLGERELGVLTKSDLGARDAGELVATSARTGDGVELLRARVLERIVGSPGEEDEGAVVTTERQRALLDRSASALRRAGYAMRDGVPAEMVAIDLREGADALAEITGERVGDEMLDALFARFCIGK